MANILLVLSREQALQSVDVGELLRALEEQSRMTLAFIRHLRS